MFFSPFDINDFSPFLGRAFGLYCCSHGFHHHLNSVASESLFVESYVRDAHSFFILMPHAFVYARTNTDIIKSSRMRLEKKPRTMKLILFALLCFSVARHSVAFVCTTHTHKHIHTYSHRIISVHYDEPQIK